MCKDCEALDVNVRKRSGSSIVMEENAVYVTPTLLLLTLNAFWADAVIFPDTCSCSSSLLSPQQLSTRNKSNALLSWSSAVASRFTISLWSGSPRPLGFTGSVQPVSSYHPEGHNPEHSTSKGHFISKTAASAKCEKNGWWWGEMESERMTPAEGRLDCPEVGARDREADRERQRRDDTLKKKKPRTDGLSDRGVVTSSHDLTLLSSPLAAARRKLPFCRKMPSAPHSSGHTKALPRLSCTGAIRQGIII